MTEPPGDMTGNTNREELLEVEKRLQKEEENIIYREEYMKNNLAKRKTVIWTQTA